jgi:hypothetical protein
MAVGTVGGSDPKGPETDVVLVSQDGTHWTRTAVDHPVHAIDVTWFGGAWIATGGTMSRSVDDGNTWAAVDLQGALSAWPFGTSSVGVAVVGQVGNETDALTSTDGMKLIWHSLNPGRGPWNAGVSVMLARDGRLLAAGNAPELDGPLVAWVSGVAPAATTAPTPSPTQAPATPTPSAGPLPASRVYTNWQPIELPDPSPHVFGGEWPYAVAEFRGQVIAVGGINGGCCAGGYSPDTRAVVWRSTDARTWALVPNRADFALGHMLGLATDGRTLVAAGSVEAKSSQGDVAPFGATWVTTNGTTWTRHTGMPIFNNIAWMQDHFYGVTEDPAAASSSVWTSAEGVSWTLVRRFSGDYLTILRATPLGLVAAGRGGKRRSQRRTDVVFGRWLDLDAVDRPGWWRYDHH